MSKTVVAVTQIKHGTNDEKYVFEPGEELDPSVFTEKQLKELYSSGAIKVEDSEEAQRAKEARQRRVDGEANQGEADQPVNTDNPAQPDPRPASVAVTAKTATGPDTTLEQESKAAQENKPSTEQENKTPAKGTSSAKK